MNQTYLEKINQHISEKLNWSSTHSALDTLTHIQLDMCPQLSWQQAQEQVIWQLEQDWQDQWLNFYWSEYCSSKGSSSSSQAA